MKYVPTTNHTQYWEVNVKSIHTDNGVLVENQTLMFDTGTYLIYGPHKYVHVNLYYWFNFKRFIKNFKCDSCECLL